MYRGKRESNPLEGRLEARFCPDIPQFVQFSEPSRHSWRRPAMRIRRNVKAPSREGRAYLASERGTGMRSTISMSNTRKITARRKNRRENGRRAEFLGSNPHSNGEDFSRSE